MKFLNESINISTFIIYWNLFTKKIISQIFSTSWLIVQQSQASSFQSTFSNSTLVAWAFDWQYIKLSEESISILSMTRRWITKLAFRLNLPQAWRGSLGVWDSETELRSTKRRNALKLVIVDHFLMWSYFLDWCVVWNLRMRGLPRCIIYYYVIVRELKNRTSYEIKKINALRISEKRVFCLASWFQLKTYQDVWYLI